MEQPTRSIRMFAIKEDDLAALERELPNIVEALNLVFAKQPEAGNMLRVKIRQVKSILSDVRWNYGPPSEVEIIPCGDGDGQ